MAAGRDGVKVKGGSRSNGRSATAMQGSAYDRFKEFGGKRYTGMKVGRRHKWRYDAGEWTEKKVTPDKWEFQYSVAKRRAGKAPEGSGAPLGTSYRWYILADQIVTKLDANGYSTEMKGLKYKLAHRRADKDAWSASERAQRKRLVQVLREMISELENPSAEPVALPARQAGPKASSTSSRSAPAKARPKAAAASRPMARTSPPPRAGRKTPRPRTRPGRLAA